MLPMFLLLFVPFCICSVVIAGENNYELWHVMRGMEQNCTVVIKTKIKSLSFFIIAQHIPLQNRWNTHASALRKQQ